MNDSSTSPRPIQISAKTLAELNMPDFNPQEFWIRMQTKFKTPFSIFPGIFSTFDTYQKKLTSTSRDWLGHWPTWVGEEVVESITCPHWSKFRWEDPETLITLSGAMDACFRLEDGTLMISDNKVAKKTDGQDKLLPLYCGQLNGYARIAEETGMGAVTRLQLVYHEPYTDILGPDGLKAVTQATPGTVLHDMMGDDSYLLIFKPVVVEIERDDELITNLLRRAREIADMETVPPLQEFERISKNMEIVNKFADCIVESRLQASAGGDICPAEEC